MITQELHISCGHIKISIPKWLKQNFYFIFFFLHLFHKKYINFINNPYNYKL
jgi:hypothetical protein